MPTITRRRRRTARFALVAGLMCVFALHVQSASVDPALGTVVVNPDGSVTFTPAPNVSGPVEIDYVVADPSGATSPSTATVTVVEVPPPVNHPPVISSDSGSITEDDPPIGGLLTASDADNAATGAMRWHRPRRRWRRARSWSSTSRSA